MVKNILNQNAKYTQELINDVEPDFIFSDKPINRLIISNNSDAGIQPNQNKAELMSKLQEKINSIENCKLKDSSNNIVMGEGDLNSPIMLVGETPGELEDTSGLSFQGEIGILLSKMLSAIQIDRKKVYSTYAINFRTPEERKPTRQEVKRYSTFLKEHISIINPKIVVLMGSTAMEAIIGFNSKISNERGKWKEIIFKDKMIEFIITFNPSYLIRFPENKKYSWEDLKKIKKKIQDLNIKF